MICMPVIGSRISLSAVAYGFLAAVKVKVTDTFTRSSGSSLGSADTGQAWTAVTGVWGTNGTQAYTNTSASSYPLATVTASSPNVTGSATAASGTGVAFWVSDANNWWCSTLTTEQYQSGTSSGTMYNSSWTCNDGTSSFVGQPEAGCALNQSYAENWCSGHGGLNVSTFTCTTSPYSNPIYSNRSRINISKRVSGTYTADAPGDGGTACSEVASSIQVVTNGDSIAVTAKNGGGTSVGTKNYTPSSPTKASAHGIIVVPVASNQGNTLDNFSLEDN